MDPDAALQRLRQLSIDVGDDAIDNDDVATEFADVFDGLDRWLTTGGFLPAEWRRP